jgi:hypothetical protein
MARCHTKGHVGNFLTQTQIRSLRMLGPLDGVRVCQQLTTLCVTLSLARFAWGDANLTDGFCLRTLSYCRPMAIMGPILDMITVSHDVVDTSCEELGWCVNICLLCPFTALVSPPPPAFPPWL